MSNLVDFPFRFHQAQGADKGRCINEIRAVDLLAQAGEIIQGHAQGGLPAHGYADAGQADAATGFRQCLGQQRDAVVRRMGRRPGADILDPGSRHGHGANGWDHGHRLAGLGHDEEPGPRRALKELGQKAGEIADIHICCQQHGVHG